MSSQRIHELAITFNAGELQRFAKFIVVGASGTLIDLLLLTVLVNCFGFSAIVANTLSFGVGVVNNYLLNRFWTFPDARGKSALTQFVQFAAINMVGLLLSDLIIVAVEPMLQGALGLIAYMPAKLIAIGLVFFWNFFANRLWTYNDAGQVITGREAQPHNPRSSIVAPVYSEEGPVCQIRDQLLIDTVLR